VRWWYGQDRDFYSIVSYLLLKDFVLILFVKPLLKPAIRNGRPEKVKKGRKEGTLGEKKETIITKNAILYGFSYTRLKTDIC
jgi:hypothetical protein